MDALLKLYGLFNQNLQSFFAQPTDLANNSSQQNLLAIKQLFFFCLFISIFALQEPTEALLSLISFIVSIHYLTFIILFLFLVLN